MEESEHGWNQTCSKEPDLVSLRQENETFLQTSDAISWNLIPCY